MKFIILEKKQDLIKKYVESGFMTKKALNMVYDTLPESQYGLADWVLHSLVWIHNLNELDKLYSDDPNTGWDWRAIKNLKNPQKITAKSLSKDSFLTMALGEFLGMVYRFRHHPSLSSNDIFTFTARALTGILSKLPTPVSKRQNKRLEKGGADKVYEDDNVLVVEPKSKAASCFYGKGTRWCTTSNECSHFEAYTAKGNLYYIMDKNKNKKYAIFIHKSGEMEAFNAEDDSINADKLIQRYGIGEVIKYKPKK